MDTSMISVFTEILGQLAEYSAAADTGTATHSQFIELQKLNARILNDRNTGYFNARQFTALEQAYLDIKDNYRVVLGLNR